MQAETIIRNGRVVNVYTGEIIRADVAKRDGRILHVGDFSTEGVTSASIYDAEGDFLIPGFFDGHAHMDLFYNPFAYARCALARDGRKTGWGFVKGYPRGLGGLASTVSHDTHGLLVLGSNPADMALAASEALKPGGGAVFVQNGEIRASIPLPLGGICSMKPVPELAAEIRQLNREIQALGTDLDNPLWTLVFLTFSSILQLRLTYEGVYDVRRKKIVF